MCRYSRVLKSREERRKKFEDVERRAEIATRKLEEKERRRTEERELRLAGRDDGSEASEESDDFIVSDESDYCRETAEAAAGEMCKNNFETGTYCARPSRCRVFVRHVARRAHVSLRPRHTVVRMPVL